MSRKCFLTSVLLAVVFSACALSQAMAAYEYFDDFTTLDSFWWTIEDSPPYTTVNHVDSGDQHFILMRQAPNPKEGGYLSGEAKLKFNFPMQGDFSASMTYNLVTWPSSNNYEIAGIRTGLGDVERLSTNQSGTQSAWLENCSRQILCGLPHEEEQVLLYHPAVQMGS